MSGCIQYKTLFGFDQRAGELTVKNSVFNEFKLKFGIFKEAYLDFANCIIRNGNLEIDLEGKCQFSNCQIFSPIILSNKSDGVFEGCKLSYEGCVIWLKTSRAWVKNCEVGDPHAKAFLPAFYTVPAFLVHNSNMKVSKCKFFRDQLLMMESTITNFVEFKQNQMMHGKIAYILKDKKSTLKEDFQRKNINERDLSEIRMNKIKIQATGKKRSEYTSDVKRQYPDQIPMFNLCRNDPQFYTHYKACYRCSSLESVTTKFKFCGRCKEACYCSTECQRLHWKEHRITCVMSS